MRGRGRRRRRLRPPLRSAARVPRKRPANPRAERAPLPPERRSRSRTPASRLPGIPSTGVLHPERRRDSRRRAARSVARSDGSPGRISRRGRPEAPRARGSHRPARAGDRAATPSGARAAGAGRTGTASAPAAPPVARARTSSPNGRCRRTSARPRARVRARREVPERGLPPQASRRARTRERQAKREGPAGERRPPLPATIRRPSRPGGPLSPARDFRSIRPRARPCGHSPPTALPPRPDRRRHATWAPACSR